MTHPEPIITKADIIRIRRTVKGDLRFKSNQISLADSATIKMSKNPVMIKSIEWNHYEI